LNIREPLPAELERVGYLFKRVLLPQGARLLVAVRNRPIERFVAAAAWWPEATIARFQIVSQPGVARGDIAGPLLDRLAQAARLAGMETLQNAELLADEHEWAVVLQSQGFERMRSERSFEVAYQDAWRRVMEMHQKYRDRIPSTWSTAPIRLHPPETVLGMIAPHRLMPPHELRKYWNVATPAGFESDWSCVLFDGQRPFGVFLLRRFGDALYIDVLVVQEANRLLRSLAELCLFYHGVSRLPPDGPVRWLQFRSGETEHRQTANLALRMSGREVSRRHVYGRKLNI
jgi:hypothetical protein